MKIPMYPDFVGTLYNFFVGGCCQLLKLLNTLASGWFWRFSHKKTAVFGCLTNALAPRPIALESCSTAQTDRPV